MTKFIKWQNQYTLQAIIKIIVKTCLYHHFYHVNTNVLTSKYVNIVSSFVLVNIIMLSGNKHVILNDMTKNISHGLSRQMQE